jgi:hypothetical protein
VHGLTAGGLAPIKMKEDSVLVDDGGDSETKGTSGLGGPEKQWVSG